MARQYPAGAVVSESMSKPPWGASRTVEGSELKLKFRQLPTMSALWLTGSGALAVACIATGERRAWLPLSFLVVGVFEVLFNRAKVFASPRGVGGEHGLVGIEDVYVELGAIPREDIEYIVATRARGRAQLGFDPWEVHVLTLRKARVPIAVWLGRSDARWVRDELIRYFGRGAGGLEYDPAEYRLATRRGTEWTVGPQF